MKRTIISLPINSGKNEVINSFLKLFIPRLKSCQKVMEALGDEVRNLETQANWFADCLLNHRFNLLTEGLQADDLRRDKKWSAANAVLVAELESFDSERKRAAEVIHKIFLSFGKIRQMGYAEQSGAMSSLCSDLLLNHKAELELLELVHLIEDLQAANDAFVRSYEERTEQMSEHNKGETQRAREAVCEAYRDFVFLFNAYVMRNGKAGMEEFIDYANTLIDQYRLMIGQGTSSKPSPTPNPDGPTPDLPGGGGSEEDTPSDGEQNTNPSNPNPENPNPENPGNGEGGDNGENGENNGTTTDPDDPWYNPDDEPD